MILQRSLTTIFGVVLVAGVARARPDGAVPRAGGWWVSLGPDNARQLGNPHAQRTRQAVAAEQVDASRGRCRRRGWTLAGSAAAAGPPRPGPHRWTCVSADCWPTDDVTFTPDGTTQMATPAGPVTIPPVENPTVCASCALALWAEALDRVVTFRRAARLPLAHPHVTPNSAHACIIVRTLAAATWPRRCRRPPTSGAPSTSTRSRAHPVAFPSGSRPRRWPPRPTGSSIATFFMHSTRICRTDREDAAQVTSARSTRSPTYGPAYSAATPTGNA